MLWARVSEFHLAQEMFEIGFALVVARLSSPWTLFRNLCRLVLNSDRRAADIQHCPFP
jgi:hypothetical protein